MFGKRGGNVTTPTPTPVVVKPEAPKQASVQAAPKAEAPAAMPTVVAPKVDAGVQIKSEEYYDTKTSVFSALIDTIDLGQLATLEPEAAREEIRDIVNDTVDEYLSAYCEPGWTSC